MIVAALCFLFIHSFVRHSRQPAKGSEAYKSLIDFLLASAGYGLSFVLISRICTMIAADIPQPIMMVLAVVPAVFCILGSVWVMTKRGEGAPERMLSDAESIAAVTLFTRYRAIILENGSVLDGGPKECESQHLINLCNEVIENHQKYPFDKLSRWMGFVQGVLAFNGLVSVEEERDYSRPFLHAIHKRKPPTYP